MIDDRLQGQFCGKLKPVTSNSGRVLANDPGNRGLFTVICKQLSLPIARCYGDPDWWLAIAYLDAQCYVVAQQPVLAEWPIKKR